MDKKASQLGCYTRNIKHIQTSVDHSVTIVLFHMGNCLRSSRVTQDHIQDKVHKGDSNTLVSDLRESEGSTWASECSDCTTNLNSPVELTFLFNTDSPDLVLYRFLCLLGKYWP